MKNLGRVLTIENDGAEDECLEVIGSNSALRFGLTEVHRAGSRRARDGKGTWRCVDSQNNYATRSHQGELRGHRSDRKAILRSREQSFHVFRARRFEVRFTERLAERTRIARELHDTLLQSFQGLVLRFQLANETVLSNPSDAKKLLEEGLDRADQALAESRKAIQGIRSVPSAPRDLAESLDALMNGLTQEVWSDKTPLPTTSVVVEGHPRAMNSSIAVEVCKIAKEALWNAFSHACARRIESEVAYSKRALRLRFRDDGIGISSAILRDGGRPGHWGISGMIERTKSIHGRLTILSKPGTGTEVELTIPGFVAFAINTSDTNHSLVKGTSHAATPRTYKDRRISDRRRD